MARRRPEKEPPSQYDIFRSPQSTPLGPNNNYLNEFVATPSEEADDYRLKERLAADGKDGFYGGYLKQQVFDRMAGAGGSTISPCLVLPDQEYPD